MAREEGHWETMIVAGYAARTGEMTCIKSLCTQMFSRKSSVDLDADQMIILKWIFGSDSVN